MIREFEILYDMGWRGSVFVVDDNFIGNQSKVKPIFYSSWRFSGVAED
jgi:hypothetical protein